MKFSSVLSFALCASSLGLAAPFVQKRSTYTDGTESNDVVNGVCAPITLIYARGSTEAGNMGTTVGKWLAWSLINQINGAVNVAVQGVDYEATIETQKWAGFNGATPIANLILQAKAQCPSTQIWLAGYSQGALVVHDGALILCDQPGLITGAVLYGDMFDGLDVINVPNVRQFCAPGDHVCEDHTPDVQGPHWSYWSNGDTDAGATYIIETASRIAGISAPIMPTSNSTSSA